jgi:apolipoprotein N-acyltransferase
MRLKISNPYILAIISGLLLSIGWPDIGSFPFLLFIAFVPLLIIEWEISKRETKRKKRKLFLLYFVAFFTWNLATSWWIYNAALIGVVSAVLLNTLLMSTVFILFHVTRKKCGNAIGFLSLVCYWISFEYLHLHWDLSWPWLQLGNGFANYHAFIQWYEYTGVFGGTAWILAVNILVFKMIQRQFFVRQSKKLSVAFTAAVVVIPIIISCIIYFSYKEKADPVNIVVVQPNIDPYNEKFEVDTEKEQREKFLKLAEQKMDPAVNYLVFPETALPEYQWENQLESGDDIKALRAFVEKYPSLKIVAGLSSRRMYMEGEKVSATARQFRQQELWYDSYNTAIQVEASKEIQLYHKSKLVAGVEQMPYPGIFKYLENFALDLGGIVGSLGVDEKRKVFVGEDGRVKVAPVICYESVYGEYLGTYIQEGANIIYIITNDGWWGNTPGHRQHKNYAKLRAIETRRSIARSANTGISCFINQRGDVSQPTGWWHEAVIKDTLNVNNETTYYTRHGDYIARAGVALAAFFFLLLLAVKFRLINFRKS